MTMKVLVASDGSENSMAAVEEAMRYSWPETAEFKVVSVVDNSLFTKADGILADQARSAVEKTVESVKKALREEAKVEGDVLYGSPKAEILEYADRWPSDLLIVGSRGLKGFKRALIGSVSHTLLLASRCSVRIGRRSVAASRDQMRILLALD